MVDTIYVEGSGDECDVRLDTWLKDLLPRTPGAVRRVVKRELILAVREFYQQSHSWRVVVGPKNIVANKSKYTLSPYDAYADVLHVDWVAINGTLLRAMVSRPPGEASDSGTVSGYYTETPDTITLWPPSSISIEAGLTYAAVLIPKRTVTHLPRISATHHYDALLDGALGRILAHPAKPYSNPELGRYHLNRFRAAIGNFKAAAIMGNNGTQSWSFPAFGI